MKVILFGATGMVGQGVLRECLVDPGVTEVLSVGRTPTGQSHPKLHELMHRDFTDFSPVAQALTGYDACFFCLGVSSAGMSEEDYRHITYDFTLAAGRLLCLLNPGITFTYVTGARTDSTEKGKMMWARVKGKTENDLLSLPFKAAYMFRPGAIQPLDGIRPKNKWLGRLLTVFGPLFPLLRKLFPKQVTTTREIGRAMLRVVRDGFPKKILEPLDIIQLGGKD